MTRTLSTAALASAVVAALVGVAAPASASQLCSSDPTAPLPSPVFITGSSAVGNFLASIGTALAGTTTIIYASPGSCQGVDAVFNGTKMGTGTATYWDNAGASHTCTLNNETADVGVSDVYYSSCTAPYLFTSIPTGVQETFGPNQVMNFVVPAASTATAISAQAAYLVYGFGASTNVVTPWSDPTSIFQRGAASGTQAMLAKAIGVPADKWLPTAGTVTGGSTGMLNAVANATNAAAAIGILASDVTDKTTPATTDGGAPVSNRSLVKILAFQGYGQTCAYLPDSSSTAYDKRNVRQGNYDVWGPVHFYTKTAGLKTAAANLIGYFNNSVTPPSGVNLLDLEIKGHTVPQCAMKVKRSAEVGPTSAYTDPSPCGCYMEELLSPGSSGCTSCTGNSGCSASQTCSHGYCEAM